MVSKKANPIDFFEKLIKDAATESINIIANNFTGDSEDTYHFYKKHYQDDLYDIFSKSILCSFNANTPIEVLFISGEAGIGKSTFVRQLLKYPDTIIECLTEGHMMQSSFVINENSSIILFDDLNNSLKNDKQPKIRFLMTIRRDTIKAWRETGVLYKSYKLRK